MRLPRTAALAFLCLSLLFLATMPGAGFVEEGWPLQGEAAGRQAEPSADVSKKELTIPDPEGDVTIQPQNPPNPAAALSQAIDIREVRVFGETGEVIRLSVKMANLQAERDNPARAATQVVTGAVYVYVCFSLASKNYVAEFRYRTDLAPLRAQVGLVDKECTSVGAKPIQPYEQGVEGTVNVEESMVELLIHRQALATVSGARPPAAGDQISNVRAIVRDGVGNAQVAGVVERGTRFDVAPDDGPSPDVLPLIYATSNQEIKMGPDSVRPLYRRCGDSRLLPAYEIEAGGMRGVPVAVFNHGGSQRVVDFEVLKEGAPAWGVRMLPNIGLPAGTAEDPANLTVNVIVQTPVATKHLECATLRVRAVDSTRSDIVGETSMNVVAIVPPSPTRNTYFAHVSAGKSWLNLDPDDRDRKDPIYLSGLATSDALAVLDIEADAKSVYDLVVNTSATQKHALVTLALRSELLPTRVHVTAYVLTSGKEIGVLGSATTIASLAEERSDVKLSIPIEYTRDEFPDGDPSRLVAGSDRVRLYLEFRALGQDENTHQVPANGRVSLLPDGTEVRIPIWETIKRNVNEPGALGAFVTLRSFAPEDAFANPGEPRWFDFIVRNEGATADVAVVEASLTGLPSATWTSSVDPPGPYELAPGGHQEFRVSVTPPLDAGESDSVLLYVVASSQADPTARGTTAVKVVATQGERLGGADAGPLEVPTKKKGLLPSVHALVVVALLGFTAWVRNRND